MLGVQVVVGTRRTSARRRQCRSARPASSPRFRGRSRARRLRPPPVRCPSGFSPTAGTSSTGTPMRGYQRAGSPSNIERRIVAVVFAGEPGADAAAGQLDEIGRASPSTPSAGQSGCAAAMSGRRPRTGRRPARAEPARPSTRSNDANQSRGRSQPPSTHATAAATPGGGRPVTARRSRPTTARRRPAPRSPSAPASAARSSAFVSVS